MSYASSNGATSNKLPATNYPTMNFSALNDRTLIRLTAALVGGALWGMMLFGYYGLVHCPLESQSGARELRIATLDRQLAGDANVQASHHQLKKRLTQLQEQIETVRRRVPEDPMIAGFLSDATQIAEEQQLGIHSFRRNATRIFDDYSEVEVVIAGEGSYENICRFLDKVNRLDRLSTIRQMELESAAAPKRYPFEVHYALQFGMKTSAEPDDEGSLL